MEVQNSTPLRFGCLSGRVPFPGHSLTLFVKGTFDLRPGLPAVLSEQQIYPTGDEYELGDEERQGGPRYSTDFVFLKERTDLLLVGRCYSPGGRPTPQNTATFQVGNLRKTLQVSGDRHWEVRDDGWAPTAPKPFTEMPLRYERAFGGEGFGLNPAGKGFIDIPAPGGQMVRPLPNIEEPKALVASPTDHPNPGGFGPLDPGWGSRHAKLGEYGGDYLRKRWPWFADGMDWGQANAAPPGLQLEGYLRGDEGLLFENLHPTEHTYKAALPGLRVRCFVNRMETDGGWNFAEVELGLDTLWVDMEAECLVLVWRGWTQVASSDHEEVGHVYIASEPMTDTPGSVEHYREEFAARLAAQPAGGGDRPSTESVAGAALGDGSPVESLAEGQVVAGDAADAAGAGNPELRRAIHQARPHLERLGIDSAELEEGDPVVMLPRLFEKLKAELRDHGIDPDKPPELTLEQKQLQAKTLSDLGIPWNAQSGLPELEDIALDDSEAMIGQEMTKLKADFRARGIEVDEPQEPTPEQKAQLALLGIDFGALKEALKGPSSATGKGGEEEEDPGQEEAPSPEWVRDRIKQGDSLANADMRGLELSGFVLSGANLSGGLLAGASLATADLEGADLRGANLAGADLRGAKLMGAHLDEADLTSADLSGADLTGATLDGASGEGAVFREAKLERCSAVGALFQGANLRRVQGRGACLDRANLTGADLEGANLFGASLRDTRLNGANAPHANMARADVSGLRASGGTKLAGASFFRAEGTRPMWMESDLAGADFRWARLEAADFTGADLTGARLHAADLPRARFRKAKLTGATLTRVNLFEGSFERADLTEADLRSSNLFAVEFLDAILSETRMERANLKRTKLILEDWKP